MDRIQDDERHDVLITLRDDELQKRRFPGWHMRWLREPWLMRLENVLIDQLHWMSELPQRSRPDGYGVESAWWIVDRIGTLKGRIEEIARQQ